MNNKPRWLALGYSVPASPSKSRVYVWRKLRDMGAQYFKSSLAVLPNTSVNLRSFMSLGEKIRELGGESWVMEMNFVTPDDNSEMEQRFDTAMADEKQSFLSECSAVLKKLDQLGSQEEKKHLVADLKKIAKAYEKNLGSRISGGMSDEIEQAMHQLREGMDGMREELSSMIKLWNKLTLR